MDISKINYYLVKIDRFFAWILLLSMFMFFISGYGMTKGIIDSGISVIIHNKILPLVIIISFVIHSGYATRLALIRWNIWTGFVKFIWAIVFLMTFFGFMYIELFYVKNGSIISTSQVKTENYNINTNPESISSTSSEFIASPSTEVVSQSIKEKVFTLDELSQYNGKNNNPAYVAVEGIVYDMTEVFKNGIHYSHIAGTELTEEFFKAHNISDITKYPIVGKLE